jgi:hypothetical protein
LVSQAPAQDVTITNLDQLAQVALSANYSIYLPFSPWDWRGYPTDWPLWCDSTSLTCLESLPTSTNFMTSIEWSNVPLASVILTMNVLSGVTTVESSDSTDVLATIAAPSGYQPYTNSADHWLWDWYVQATNNPDWWGFTPGQIPPPIITLQTYLADSNAFYSVYESNLAAEAASGSGGGVFSPMFGGWGMDFGDDDGDPCLITNYLAPFNISSIAPDGSGDIILQWPSCTNAVYVVQSENSLTPTSSWTDVAWMFGTDQQTSWTDTNAVGMTQNFYQVVQANPNTLNDGIPYWWAVTYGLDPLDPNLAWEDSAGDAIDNLEKYDYGLSPQTAYPVNVTINQGNGWATNQIISVNTSNTPPFAFVEISLYPNMTNATVLSNSATSLQYVLPSTNNGTYNLFFQYADANTNALGPIVFRPVTLDTIPPVVQITSPSNGTGNQAFVHLHAIAYDPDPQNPSQPGPFRPLKIWIDGQPYWNINNTVIDISRFPVLPNTNNVITVSAQDQAGNRTQATVNWYVNTSTATNAPQLSFANFQTNTVTTLPNLQQVWMSGQVDNPFAIITATVNSNTPITVTVQSNQFGYLLPLNFGTNAVLIIASDAAGNASSNNFTLVNGNDYELTITSPSPYGFYANGQPQVVSGTVSQYRDAGLPNQTNIVSVTVNGIGTTLTGPDGNSNMDFTTTSTVPVNTNGFPTVLNIIVTWANGVVDPPLG